MVLPCGELHGYGSVDGIEDDDEDRVEARGEHSREALDVHPHDGWRGLPVAMIAVRAGSRSGGAVRLPAEGDADLAELTLEISVVREEDAEGEQCLV